MGQGQDKIARSLTDLQPTAIVELFQLHFNTIDKPDAILMFHGGAIFEGEISWQGKKYGSLPVESEGFEVNASNQLPRPKIRISNKDYAITQALLNNKDFQFGKLIRKRTFVKYLDDINFDGGNPWGQADSSAELSLDTFVISQKTAENKVFVEFELSSPLDLENFEVNNRLIIARYCSWYYRGNGCNYEGLPIETEYGQTLKLNNDSENKWNTIFSTGEWDTGIYYESGTPAFRFNNKITINPRPGTKEKSRPAKIWYVSQSGHVSTEYNAPDNNETFWLKDGCNKKLDGCKKRFSNGELQTSETTNYPITNSYINFSHKSRYNSNNIASEASITGSSVLSGSSFRNVVDGLTGVSVKNVDTAYSWVSSGAANPYIQFTWDRPRLINRIDLYDRQGNNNFGDASIKLLLNGDVEGSLESVVYNSGSRSTNVFNASYIDQIIISGISSDTNAGLGEVCIFEPSGLAVYNDDFLSSGIATSKDLHIASYFSFPNGVTRNDQLLNIFHNVKTNCQYSGLNLYASGGNLVLDFATRQYSGAPTPSYTTVNRSISMPWDFQTNQPFYLEAFGGQTSGTGVTSFPEGYIKMYGADSSTFAEYILKPRNPQLKFSGEFFLFKNPSYTGSTTSLKFGINDWQFSSGDTFTPNPRNSGVYSNIKLTSNIKLGATAIWTGFDGIDARKEFFNREDDNKEIKFPIPRTYAEFTGVSQNKPILKTGLFAWWDMDITGTSSYSVSASNNQNLKINLSGEYTGSIDLQETNYITQFETTLIQTSQNSLPFGGFPGTDRYGR